MSIFWCLPSPSSPKPPLALAMPRYSLPRLSHVTTARYMSPAHRSRDRGRMTIHEYPGTHAARAGNGAIETGQRDSALPKS